MDTEEKIAAFVWIQVVMAVLSQVLLVAFVAGFIVGHFLTGSDEVTTVSAAAVVEEEAAEAAAEEAAPAEAEKRAEAEEAKKVDREEEAVLKKQGEEAEAEAAKEKEEGGGEEAGGEEEAAGEVEEGGGGEMALTAGKEVFTSNCGSCHTLADAGTTGAVGPNLDELMPEQSLVETQVTNGGGGMPAFGGQLSDEEIKSVSEYVASVAGG